MIEKVIPSAWVRAALWLVARVWVGWKFLDAGWGKLFGSEQSGFFGAHAGSGVQGFLTGATSPANTSGPYASVLPPYTWLAQNVLIPHAAFFGYLVAFGETLVGLALIVGVLTRFAAFTGAFINLMFLLAGTTGLNPYMFTIELSIALVGVSAGLIGLDYVALPFIKAQWAKYIEHRATSAPRIPGRHAPRPVH